MRILRFVVSIALLASVASAQTAPALSNDHFVALSADKRLYLFDKSLPAWFVFDLAKPASSVRFSKRDAVTGDTELLINGKRARFGRFKGVLVFSPSATIVGRRPSFELQVENKAVRADTWSLSESQSETQIVHASPNQLEYRFTLRMLRP